MKVDLEKIVLGVSPLTSSVFAGTVSKNNRMWLQKHDVTNSFVACVISKYEGHVEEITDGKNVWEITVKKIKKQA